jgi:AcrR family transcriptional regulator
MDEEQKRSGVTPPGVEAPRSQQKRPKGALVRDDDGRRTRSHATHERIIKVVLDAALTGDWRVPINHVAQRAGCSVRNVFQHFGSAADLRNEVIRRHKQELISKLPNNFTELLNLVMEADYSDEVDVTAQRSSAPPEAA